MKTWSLHPWFETKENGNGLTVEVFEVDAEGNETSLETLHLNRESVSEVWPSEGILEQLVREQIEQERHHLILDLQGLGKADSTNIGDIVAAIHRTNLSGGQLLLANPTPRIREIFHRTELDRLFPIFDSVVAARRQFKP